MSEGRVIVTVLLPAGPGDELQVVLGAQGEGDPVADEGVVVAQSIRMSGASALSHGEKGGGSSKTERPNAASGTG